MRQVDRFGICYPIAIEAKVPGAGKTTLVEWWLERTGQKKTALFVCPWNALASALKKRGFRAITLHELIGKMATEDGADRKKAYNVDEVTHIHFEEAYLYPVHQLGWVRKFMVSKARTANCTYSMAGDPNQLVPVKQDLAVDSDNWYEIAFASMFPRRLVLEISKRVPNEAEAIRMRNLCDELRDENKAVSDILADANLSRVNFDDLGEEDARYPHVAALCSTVARVDNWAHNLIGNKNCYVLLLFRVFFFILNMILINCLKFLVPSPRFIFF
jgi:hypothetical protein